MLMYTPIHTLNLALIKIIDPNGGGGVGGALCFIPMNLATKQDRMAFVLLS